MKIRVWAKIPRKNRGKQIYGKMINEWHFDYWVRRFTGSMPSELPACMALSTAPPPVKM